MQHTITPLMHLLSLSACTDFGICQEICACVRVLSCEKKSRLQQREIFLFPLADATCAQIVLVKVQQQSALNQLGIVQVWTCIYHGDDPILAREGHT
jgi:hypothetical protein